MEVNPERSEAKEKETQPKPNTPPPEGARIKDLGDDWVTQGRKIIRQLRKPRLVTFTPVNTSCPIDVGKLKGRRLTHAVNLGTGEIKVIEDDWKSAVHPYFNQFGTNARWTGWTEFEIEEELNLPAEEDARGGVKRKVEEDQEINPEPPEGEAHQKHVLPEAPV